MLESEFLGHSGVLFKGNPAALRYQSHHHHKHYREVPGKELQSNTSTQVSLILFPFRQIPDYSHLPAVPSLISFPVELEVNLLQRVEVAALSQRQLHPEEMYKSPLRGEKSSSGTDVQPRSCLMGTICVLSFNKRCYFQRLLL